MKFKIGVLNVQRCKIVLNKERAITEQFNLNNLKNNYLELCQLIDMFSLRAIPQRLEELKNHRLTIDSTYKPTIQDLENKLRNTKRRLKYNMEKY
jgi:hypothetical protein